MNKSNNPGLTKTILSVILVLCFLLLINYIPKLLKKDASTILPIDFEYKETLPIQGIIIKNEKLYFSKTKGEVYGIVDEGMRVPVGMEIAQVISSKDMTFYKSQLDSIERLIDQINLSTSSTANLTTGVQMTDTLISQIQLDIQNKKYNSLEGLKDKLFFTLDNENIDLETVNSETLSYEQLIAKKNNLLQEISNYNERLFSRHSGIVSYEIDSLEDIVDSSDLDGAADYIFDSHINTNLESDEDDKAVFKIIDGHEYYIAIKLSKTYSLLLRDFDKLEVEIIDLDDKKINLKAPIINRFYRGTEEIIMLKSNELLEKIYNQRFVNLEIVTLKKDSFKIPIESMITNNGQQGVFVRAFYDVVVFRPIIINAKDENFVYANKGDADNKIEIKNATYKTINEFSEIIVNPSFVEEGQILN